MGIVGVVLVRPLGGQHPDARGQGGRDVEDLFASSHQLLGQQIAKASCGLDGPGALLEALGPVDELFHLATGRSHLDARELVFISVERHRSV
jgi:hypothetical protein